MWGAMKSATGKYPFSSRSSGIRESDDQSNLTPVYSEILSHKKTASTSLAIPTQKPIFTHSELLQSLKESMSGSNLPPDPAGPNKENHPLFRKERNQKVPTLFYLDDDGRIDDATTGNPALLPLTTELSNSYSEYLSNGRSEYEAGYPVAQRQNKGFEATHFRQAERHPRPTALEAKRNSFPAQRQPISSLSAASHSGSYRLHRLHQRMGSVGPLISRSQSAQYLNERSQIGRSMGRNELLSNTSGEMTSPRHYNNQASHSRLPTSRLQLPAHREVPPGPPGPAQRKQGNPGQTPHPGHLIPAPNAAEEEELPKTMAQILAFRRERVIEMCGFPDPPLMPNSPLHLNRPPPSKNLPLPSPPAPLPDSTLQASGTHPTFNVPRKPLPPSALQNLSRQTSAPEASPTKNLKNLEQANMKPGAPPTPLPRSKSALSLGSMRSNISGRSV
ncbi:hypothetical protein HOY82DRAFT_630057 [Tuber indicum]|nr:hypothetical protein HOY82DRAFT_630057 [Tuber indicum]